MNTTIRDVDSLVSAIDAGLHPKWIFFWGHQPSRDGSVTKSCFSQWWQDSPFEMDGITYKTAEHYMMAEKAKLFGDTAMAERIIAAEHPGEAKKLGRAVAGFDTEVWQHARFDIVVRGNFAKFSRHPAIRDFLLGTGDRILVEASPRDRIWGIGLSAKDPDAEHPWMWNGLNLLGFALMEVRERLQ